MNTQHTPGPWKIAEKSETGSYYTITSELGYVCNGWGPGSSVDAANARLIAAAPELLAACQKVHDNLFVLRLEYQHLSPGLRSGIQHQLDMLRSAIAQATGNEILTPAVSENLNQPLK